MSKLNCYVAGIPRVCSYHLATERVKRKGGGSPTDRGLGTRRRGEKLFALASSSGNEIKSLSSSARGRASKGRRIRSSRLLSRVPSGFETGCNVIFDNLLIRRDLYSVGMRLMLRWTEIIARDYYIFSCLTNIT